MWSLLQISIVTNDVKTISVAEHTELFLLFKLLNGKTMLCLPVSVPINRHRNGQKLRSTRRLSN